MEWAHSRQSAKLMVKRRYTHSCHSREFLHMQWLIVICAEPGNRSRHSVAPTARPRRSELPTSSGKSSRLSTSCTVGTSIRRNSNSRGIVNGIHRVSDFADGIRPRSLNDRFKVQAMLAKFGQICDNRFSHKPALERCEELFCVFLLHMEVVGVLRREDLEKNQGVGIVLPRGRV